MTKILKLLVLILLVGVFTVGCNSILPNKMPLNNSIKDILTSKDEDYDFLEDKEFLKSIDDYANTIPNIDKDIEYAIGNLDDKDNIPELAVFMDKDPDKLEGHTELVVYKFDGDSYNILDRVDMNHDTSNHLLEIGHIAEDQKGLFISNNVGAHSTVTYGFILEEGKLKSILNENKVSLISIHAENQIKDIDNDGILEFSIYTLNPERDNKASDDEEDMMSIWYKWDGSDGANVVMTETSTIATTDSRELLDESEDLGLDKALRHLDDNLEYYSQYEITQVLKAYIERLEENYSDVNQSPHLIELYRENDNHKLSLERLNDLSYVSSDKVLDKDLRAFLHNNLKLGYKLVESEGQYYFIVDNQRIIDKYEENISRLFLNYLEIKALNSNEPYLKDGSLVIDRDNLAERIVAIENYRLVYPYSRFLPELNSIYNEYMRIFILGSINSPNYDTKTSIFSEGSVAVFKKVANNHPNTHLSDVLDFVIDELKNNSNMLTVDLREDIEQKF